MAAAKAEKPGKAPKKVVRSSPALDLLEKGIKQLHDQEYKAARSSFQAIIDKYPEERDIGVRAASYLKTCETFLSPPAFTPHTPDDYYNLGILKHNEGNYDEAIRLFSEASKLDSKGDHIYYALAAAHALKNDLPSVLKNLERAIKINPDNLAFAKSDPDFDGVRKEPGFAELLGVPLAS